MEHKRAEYLLDRYLSGQCTEQEQAIVESWFLAETEAYGDDMPKPVYDEVKVRLWAEIQRQNKNNRQVSRLWPRISIAAAVAAVVFGIWFYTSHNSQNEFGIKPELVSGFQDIAPGKNTATLTLSNGKTIQLSDAKTGVVVGHSNIVYNDSTALSGLQSSLPNAGTSMLTAATPRGGTYQITLPDGTKVWLNAASKLEFPSDFKNVSQRIVKLEGEGYFEVAKNKAQPFVVKSAGQQVEVLGTHFNINSYADEGQTKTTLLEGSVTVSALTGLQPSLPKGETVLKPNEQAILTGENIRIKAVDPNLAISWKEGLFTYKDTRLDELMRQISRWYDVEVVYTSEALKGETFKGSVSRYDHVSRILKTLEFTGAVKFKIEGKKIIVMK